jgi:hypothetical protein
LNWNLLIFRERILDSRIEAGMPSLAAAPLAPEIFPLLCASAASIRCRSFDFRSVAAVDDCGDEESKNTFQEAVYSVRIGTTGYRAIAADVFLDNWFA